MMVLKIIVVSFIGLYFLIHICSKSDYVLEYSSNKRKIKIYPYRKKKDKSYQSQRKGKA